MRTTLAIVILAVAPAWAHHAFQAEFDDKKPVKLTGKVTEMEWINPHAWIHIDVTGPDGKVTNWMVECGSPNIMLRRGFYQAVARSGDGAHHSGLSGQERAEQSQRQQRDVQGRQEAVRGRIEPGHSGGSK